MRTSRGYAHFVVGLVALAAVVVLTPSPADSACCYFTAQDKDVQQPAQKAFLTWDPAEKVETFTVQPKFEGNAADFGMVIPTPGQPKLDEMPRDFFKELAVYTVLKRREQPESHLLQPGFVGFGGGLGALGGGLGALGFGGGVLGMFGGMAQPPRPSVSVVESGVVGALDYKVLTADRADDLYTWLKEHKYHYAGDEAALDFYVKKKWHFTVMKIDTVQMKRRPDGTYDGEVTPTRFQFTSEKLVYPLKITQLSVKEKTDALFYVQAPYKVDLPGDLTYQYQWVSLLQSARGLYGEGTSTSPKLGGGLSMLARQYLREQRGVFASELPGGGEEWLTAAKDEIPELRAEADKLGFSFGNGLPPGPNPDGVTPTTLEWAKRLTAGDLGMLAGTTPFSDKVPDVDEGFTGADMQDARKETAARKVISARLEKYRLERPAGYLVREAPAEDVKQLRILRGHLRRGQFLTKIHKTFTRGEMDDDLVFVPAGLGKVEDRSEYEEILPTAPP
jgi:hypothetical protein